MSDRWRQRHFRPRRRQTGPPPLKGRVVAFYNQRGTAEQWIKEGKGAIKWTRLSCRSFAANAARLQLHVLTTIGAKVVSHGRYVTFQMAEVAVSPQMFADILWLIARLWAPAHPRMRG